MRFILLFLFTAPLLYTSDLLIKPLTHEIYYRFYIVNRCENSINVLLKHDEIWEKINFDHLLIDCIESQIIKEYVLNLKKTGDKGHLAQLWNQIKTHRNINDYDFQKDFVKVLFMLYSSFEHPVKKQFSPCPHQLLMISVESMFESIEKNMDDLNQKKPKISTSHHKQIDHKEVNIDDIALTYYLIQRLSKSITVLSAIETMRKPTFNATNRTNLINLAELEREIGFSNDRINDCFAHILIQKDCEPLMQIWRDFMHFRYAGDTLFLKEMLMMLFVVYKDLLLSKLHEESEQIIINEIGTILNLYEHLDELPLNQILNAIDLATDKLLFLQNKEKKVQQQFYVQNRHIWLATLIALPFAYTLFKLTTL